MPARGRGRLATAGGAAKRPPAAYVPERGDVVWLDFTPQAGREQAGRRPAVVLSPGAYNRLVGLAVVCPLTTRVKGYPFEVAVPPGRKATGVVLADQVRSLDWRERHAERFDQLPPAVVAHILAAAKVLLD